MSGNKDNENQGVKSKEASKPTPKKKAGRQPGTPKSGGRKPGTPNKNKRHLLNAFDEAGFNVIEEYMRLYASLDDAEKFREVRSLFKFMFPQLKEVETLPEPKPEQKPNSDQNLISLAKK